MRKCTMLLTACLPVGQWISTKVAKSTLITSLTGVVLIHHAEIDFLPSNSCFRNPCGFARDICPFAFGVQFPLPLPFPLPPPS